MHLITAVCSPLTPRLLDWAERLPDQTANSFLLSPHMLYGLIA